MTLAWLIVDLKQYAIICLCITHGENVMNMYAGNFHKNRHENTINSAEIILSIVQDVLPQIRSAVDLGCGVGTWLQVLERKGVDDVCGLDGPWVKKDDLKIRPDKFVQHNLGANPRPDIGRSFDLAISLEVAEHLPQSAAKPFVETLTRLSDFVLFSAAIPNQGGTGHINEQWSPYWISLFKENDFFAVDLIRKRVWNNDKVMRQYRQNVFLFVNSRRLADLRITASPSDHIPAEIYSLAFEKAIAPGIKKSLAGLFTAIKVRVQSSLS